MDHASGLNVGRMTPIVKEQAVHGPTVLKDPAEFETLAGDDQEQEARPPESDGG